MLIGRLSQMSPAPLSLWHCDPELCSIEKRFNWKDGPFHGPSYTIESQWGKFSTPPAPQGCCNFYPILRYGLTEPASLFKCGQFHISVKSTLWATRHQIFFAMLSQWGNFGTLLPPRGATFTPFWRCGLTEPASLFKCGKFQTSVKSTLWSYEASKFFAMLSQCVWFCPYFAPGANIVPPDRL